MDTRIYSDIIPSVGWQIRKFREKVTKYYFISQCDKKMYLRGQVVENHILEILLMNKKLSIKEIHLALAHQYDYEISLPQLYKIIQKLTKEYVLVRKHGVVMFNAWRIRQVKKDVEQLSVVVEQVGNIDFIKHGTT